MTSHNRYLPSHNQLNVRDYSTGSEDFIHCLFRFHISRCAYGRGPMMTAVPSLAEEQKVSYSSHQSPAEQLYFRDRLLVC